MQIKYMNKIKNPQGQARAFFAIETASYIFTNLRLMEAADEKLYTHLPVREYLRGGRKIREQWYQFKDLDMLEAVTALAREFYEKLR